MKIYTIFIILGIVLFTGCSSRDFRQEGRRPMNISDEERQKMFEEMQQNMIKACEGKNENDVCQFEGRIGMIEGICKLRDNNLICTSENQTRPDINEQNHP